MKKGTDPSRSQKEPYKWTGMQGMGDRILPIILLDRDISYMEIVHQSGEISYSAIKM